MLSILGQATLFFYALHFFSPLSATFYLPAAAEKCIILGYSGYTVQFNPLYHQADWVAYELTEEEARAHAVNRSNVFRVDPRIKNISASNDDYRFSGFDRGHLAPAADMRLLPQLMADSFYYSNIAPQISIINRGIWSALENQVRGWAERNASLYIISGPIYNDYPVKVFGENNIAIPSAFYKVILDYSIPEIKSIAFIIPNNTSTHLTLAQYACSIDTVETATGLDFFPELNALDQLCLESSFDISQWSLSD